MPFERNAEIDILHSVERWLLNQQTWFNTLFPEKYATRWASIYQGPLDIIMQVLFLLILKYSVVHGSFCSA